MRGELGFITLGVADLDHATRFYRSVLGLPLHGAAEDVVFLRLGRLRLALYARTALARDCGQSWPAKASAPMALCLNLDSAAAVDAMLARASAEGGACLRPASQPPWGGWRGYLRDPDGHLWEIVWHPEFSLSQDAQPLDDC